MMSKTGKLKKKIVCQVTIFFDSMKISLTYLRAKMSSFKDYPIF